MKRNSLLLAIVLCVIATVAVSQPTSASPAVSTTIVISQAYGGGGGTSGTYLFDYVELKNISNTQQSLNGLSLMYGSATGQFGSSATNIFALPNVTLNPGQYFLVQLSTTGTGGTAFPVTPDATTTNLSMSGTNGKVALVTSSFTGNTCGATATPCTLPNAGIIDLVAWGTANNAEGSAATNGGASLTATQGNVRKNGGCQDQDNNNGDFDIVSNPVPRNMSSTATACSGGPVAPVQHVLDFNGDGRTDFSVVRNVGGGANGQAVWYNLLSGTATSGAVSWGLASDFFVPADYDGDSKTDLSIWRPGASGSAAWYTLLSSDSTVRFENFGQTGDDPTVVGDYDGDGKDDIAVYREGTVAAPQSTWYFRTVVNGPVVFVPWGQANDFPAPGDYDGDGKNDFSVQRDGGGGQAVFITRLATGPTTYTAFGNPSDGIAPGDYDGDGKTDFAVFRDQGGVFVWYYLPSSGGSYVTTVFGSSAVDKVVQGDYDGDGRTDQAVWRTTTGQFWVNNSSAAGVQVTNWGSPGDYPTANSYTH